MVTMDARFDESLKSNTDEYKHLPWNLIFNSNTVSWIDCQISYEVNKRADTCEWEFAVTIA